MSAHRHASSDPTTAAAVFAELVARTEGLQPWRRVFHAASGLLLAWGPGALGLEPRVTTAVLAASTGALLAFDLLRLRIPGLNRAFFRWFSHLASPREAKAVASSTWYALGATLVWGFAPGIPAVASLLVLGLADPAASVVGRRWGRARLGKGTWVGSTAFVVVAFAVLLTTVGLPAAIVGAAVAAAAEVVPMGVDDNLTIPLATSAVLWLMLPAPLP